MARASVSKRTKPLCRCPTPTASLNDSRITSTRRSLHGVSEAKTRRWKAAKRWTTSRSALQLPSDWATPQVWLKVRCARARTGGWASRMHDSQRQLKNRLDSYILAEVRDLLETQRL